MIACAYCEHPLICERCQQVYLPPSQAHYEALSHGEDVITCPACEHVLVCHWCKTPYDGAGETEGEGENQDEG
jgi:hypothetical protein